jgi:hypothetical protein
MNGRAVVSSPARSNVSTSIFASIIWSLLGLERLAVYVTPVFFPGLSIVDTFTFCVSSLEGSPFGSSILVSLFLIVRMGQRGRDTT